jgi:hypothetical protein
MAKTAAPFRRRCAADLAEGSRDQAEDWWSAAVPLTRSTSWARRWPSAPGEIHAARIPLVPKVSRLGVGAEPATIIHGREILHA